MKKRNTSASAGRELYFHKAHPVTGQDHLHFCMDRAKLDAINRDGTAHDQSHGKQMQRWAVDAVRSTPVSRFHPAA